MYCFKENRYDKKVTDIKNIDKHYIYYNMCYMRGTAAVGPEYFTDA